VLILVLANQRTDMPPRGKREHADVRSTVALAPRTVEDHLHLVPGKFHCRCVVGAASDIAAFRAVEGVSQFDPR
jgi:hypothetical protein